MQVGCWSVAGGYALSAAFIRIPLVVGQDGIPRAVGNRTILRLSLYVEIVPQHFQVLLSERLKWPFDGQAQLAELRRFYGPGLVAKLTRQGIIVVSKIKIRRSQQLCVVNLIERGTQ